MSVYSNLSSSYSDEIKKKCYAEDDDNTDNSISCNNVITITITVATITVTITIIVATITVTITIAVTITVAVTEMLVTTITS